MAELHPDADVTDGNWLNESAGSTLSASIDEITINDSDFIRSAAMPLSDVCEVALGDSGGTPGQPMTVSYRYKKSGARTISLVVKLMQGSTTIATWIKSSITTTFVTATETLSGAEFAVISDFTDLRLRFEATAELTSTLAWVAEVVSNGGTVSPGRETIVDELVVGLKADAIWSKLDRLWLFAAENEASALTDLVGLTLATTVNSPAFAIDGGYTGVNGSNTVYINTNYNPFTAGGNWTQNYAHMSAWSTTDVAGTFAGYFMGSYHTVNDVFNHIIPKYQDGYAYLGVNELNTGDPGTAVANSIGYYCTSRISSTTSNGYKNAVSLYDSGLTSNASINNLDIYILAMNNDVSAFAGAGHQCAVTSIGGGLTSTEVLALYNRLRTYMTAVGVP